MNIQELIDNNDLTKKAIEDNKFLGEDTFTASERVNYLLSESNQIPQAIRAPLMKATYSLKYMEKKERNQSFISESLKEVTLFDLEKAITETTYNFERLPDTLRSSADVSRIIEAIATISLKTQMIAEDLGKVARDPIFLDSQLQSQLNEDFIDLAKRIL